MKLIITLLLFILQTVCCGHLYAQKQGAAAVDSMLLSLPKQKDDTNKVKLLNSLSHRYHTIDPDKGLVYGQQALTLAEKLGWTTGAARANKNLGVNYLDKADYTKALEYLFIALTLSEETGDKNDMSSTATNIGNVYFNQSDYPKAMEYYLQSLRYAEEAQNKGSEGTALSNIGIVYASQNNYAKALEYLLKSLKIEEETSVYLEIASTASNIGVLYAENLRDYRKALEYHFKALRIDEKMENKSGVAWIAGNIGSTFKELKEYKKAFAYYQIALSTSRDIGDISNYATVLGSIGALYLTIAGDIPHSMVNESVNDSFLSKYPPTPAIPKGTYLLLSAIDSLKRGLAIGRELNEPRLIEPCYTGLSKAYKMSGDYKAALAYSDSLAIVKDSILSNDNKVKVANLATKREQELKEKQIAINKLETDKKRNERLYFTAGLSLMLLLIAGLVFNLRYVRRSREAIQNEKDVSEGLLLNILPLEVAKELKEKGHSEARHFEQVTVLFTDFKDFTLLSEKMSAEELVAELDHCFKGFDSIIHKHGVEKIKTIGDSYMAVGGIPDANPAAANNVVAAAVEMKDFILGRGTERANAGKLFFEMRIGIHTGPVTAGIVGNKKFQYDIWGDTVNIASRMESNGETGKVNVSQSTYELVKDTFPCHYRGEIDAKGKGMMKMYFVS